MADGPLAALASDWRAALDAGRARNDYPPPGSWLLLWALACLGAVAAIYFCCGYHGGFLPLNTAAQRLPEAFWQITTVLGDERVAFALSLLLARRHPRIFWSLIVAALLATAYTHTLKPLFDAARPPAVLAAEDFRLIGRRLRHEAFPSGHSATAAVLYGTLAYYARGAGWRAALITLAVIVGLSRVALGVHWPVDVAAGLGGGALAAWLGARLATRVTWGIDDASIHLAFVTLGAIMAAALLLWDGGYPQAAGVQYLIGLATLGYAVTAYLLGPLARWARRSVSGAGER